ncbi:hypothetical protein [Arthrobacter sp. UYCu712]|uniref:hypothetical protein n=1 Tax=Arthrobacter sp. UYCu712 TaxID=3156340 RepID=UPI00339324DB
MRVRSLAEPWLDTPSAHGKLIFDMFASLDLRWTGTLPGCSTSVWASARSSATAAQTPCCSNSSSTRFGSTGERTARSVPVLRKWDPEGS